MPTEARLMSGIKKYPRRVAAEVSAYSGALAEATAQALPELTGLPQKFDPAVWGFRQLTEASERLGQPYNVQAPGSVIGHKPFNPQLVPSG